MYFILLATDYDGTLAHDGEVDGNTLDALERLRASGRKLLLVTGRHLPDLLSIFPRLDLFDRVIVENGGVLYNPHTREEKSLCDPPNPRFLAALREKNIPFSVGRTIVATWRPHDTAMLETIRDLGLDLQVIFNKESVMVLPSGVNKGTALEQALDEIGISRHNVVSVGDAENDLPFLRMSGCSAVVANALPSLKERADLVLEKPRGQGVTELINWILADDLAKFDSRLQRHSISLGQRLDDKSEAAKVLVSSRGAGILVTGSSGSGKSTAVAGILEQLVECGYQFCLIDPEGDYDGFTDALSFGNAKEAPDKKALFRALESPERNAVVNLLGVSLDDRAAYFSSILPRIQDLRTRTARPHWLIIDEAHHMLPSSWSQANATAPQLLESTILITVHPEHVAPAALKVVDVVVAVGKSPIEVLRAFARAVKIEQPPFPDRDLGQGEALIWFRRTKQEPVLVKAPRSRGERLRHLRQYAEGELSPEQSFYFRGPESKLKLRAQNLKIFLQLAEGVDDETWMYHLRNGDYSNWFESMIKDEELTAQAAEIEQDERTSPQDSRQRIKEAVEARYTAPA
jgi:HAD superfamily hydrolase (TIGR01484 family)